MLAKATLLFALIAGSIAPDGRRSPPPEQMTGVILHDVAGELCRHQELAGTTVQVPNEEYRPIYLPRVYLIFAEPGMIPTLQSKYGRSTTGGIGLHLYLKPIEDSDSEEKFRAEIASAFADKENCDGRLILALLKRYRAKGGELPKVYD